MRPSQERRRTFLHAATAVALLGGGLAAFPARTEERVVKIVAGRFVAPREVALKKGQPVILELTTADVAMGFNCPEFNVRADIIPGQAARVRFTPERTGTFPYLCDAFCGDGHEGMSGMLRVEA